MLREAGGAPLSNPNNSTDGEQASMVLCLIDTVCTDAASLVLLMSPGSQFLLPV